MLFVQAGPLFFQGPKVTAYACRNLRAIRACALPWPRLAPKPAAAKNELKGWRFITFSAPFLGRATGANRILRGRVANEEGGCAASTCEWRPGRLVCRVWEPLAGGLLLEGGPTIVAKRRHNESRWGDVRLGDSRPHARSAHSPIFGEPRSRPTRPHPPQPSASQTTIPWFTSSQRAEPAIYWYAEPRAEQNAATERLHIHKCAHLSPAQPAHVLP